MLVLTFFLTQAVPIRADLLGARLAAYVLLLPTITALRLCNRFGKGPQATVAKLPVELLNEIEKYLIEDKRAQLYEEWFSQFKCYETQCSPADHFDKEQCADIFFDGGSL